MERHGGTVAARFDPDILDWHREAVALLVGARIRVVDVGRVGAVPWFTSTVRQNYRAADGRLFRVVDVKGSLETARPDYRPEPVRQAAPPPKTVTIDFISKLWGASKIPGSAAGNYFDTQGPYPRTLLGA